MDRHAMAGIASAVLFIGAMLLMRLGDAEARDFVDNVWIVFGVAFAAFIGESAAKVVRRRKASSSTPASDREPTTRVRREGYADVEVLVVVALLAIAVFAGLTGCGGSSAGVVDAEEPAAGVDVDVLCTVTETTCAGCLIADQQYCATDEADEEIACVLTEELCGLCMRSYARWCEPRDDGAEAG